MLLGPGPSFTQRLGHAQIRLIQQITTGRPPTGRSRTQVGRRSFARATAPTLRTTHQIGGGLDQQLQLAASVRGGQDLEPGQPEQGSRHRRRIVIRPRGLSRSRSLGRDRES
jgi:hypothetical protein